MTLKYGLDLDTCTPKMKFLGQGFQKFEHEQDRHTDATERITRAAFAGRKIGIFRHLRGKTVEN